MLSLMRKHAGSWMIKVILFAIVVVFIFWGVGSFRSRNETQVAKVNGEAIDHQRYIKTYNNLIEQYRRIYGGRLSEEMITLFKPKETAINQLIDLTLMRQEAERLSISVTDQEIDEAIQNIPAFQVNGVFDKNRAERLLSLNNLNSDQFRGDMKEELRIRKLRELVIDGIAVSDEEVRQWYDWSNAEINIEYLLFAPESYRNISINEEEIKAYFEEHRGNYKTEPKVKARYLFFNPETYKAEVNLTDGDVSQYYDTHPEEFRTEKTVEARHILLKLPSQVDEKTVAQKKDLADKIVAMAKGGKEFAELAKQYSEDSTRDKGGYLGAFTYQSMVKPFADRAFAMEPGTISEPVRTQYGWHVIKVEKVNDAQLPELVKVASQIRAKLVSEKTRAIALKKAETIFENFYDGDDLSEVAKGLGIPLGETDFFSLNKPPTNVGDSLKFAEAAFALEKLVLSEVLDLSDGVYLLQVTERLEAEVPPLESVVAQVKADFLKQRQDESAKKEAEMFIEKVAKGSAFKDAASQVNLSVQETGFFKRTGSIPKLGNNPAIAQAAFHLNSEKPAHGDPLKGNQGWYAIRLKERKLPDEEGFVVEKGKIARQLGDQKRQISLQQWMVDLKGRSKIDINQKLVQ